MTRDERQRAAELVTEKGELASADRELVARAVLFWQSLPRSMAAERMLALAAEKDVT